MKCMGVEGKTLALNNLVVHFFIVTLDIIRNAVCATYIFVVTFTRISNVSFTIYDCVVTSTRIYNVVKFTQI